MNKKQSHYVSKSSRMIRIKPSFWIQSNAAGPFYMQQPFLFSFPLMPHLTGTYTHYIGPFLSSGPYTCRSSKPLLEHLSHQTPLSVLCELRQQRQHRSGVFSTLMRPGEQLQCIQCGGGSLYLDISCFFPVHASKRGVSVAGMYICSSFQYLRRNISLDMSSLFPVTFEYGWLESHCLLGWAGVLGRVQGPDCHFGPVPTFPYNLRKKRFH